MGETFAHDLCLFFNYALKLLVESLFFNELELCDNIARNKFSCPQHNNANRGACPPSFISFIEINYMLLIGGWNEGSLTRSSERID